MSSHMDRVVVLVDMDCFYCQVEEKLDPNLAGKPLAVVQYNAWKGGGIIAVNYPARDRGVTRHMRGDEAKQICPEIELARVPNVRGKADLTKYREAGKRVAEVLQTFTSLLQRASVDEAYLDITEAVNQRLKNSQNKVIMDQLKNTHVVGCETEDFLYNIYNEMGSESNIKLAVGGAIVEEIRAAVFEKTGYRCSAGIAHNKMLAKLACGLHKPNQQTILPQDGVAELYETLPLRKIKNLGGKFGESLAQKLNIKYMSELANFSEHDLMKKYDDKTALWLFNIARGIDTDPVTVRLISKSIGCCKKFPGQNALKTPEEVNHWLTELATEISERLEQDLEENNRRAKQIILSFAQPVGRKDVHSSRTQVLNSYETKKITDDCYETLKKFTQKPDGSFCLKFLGLSAGKFEDCKNMNSISSFFKTTVNDDETQQESDTVRTNHESVTLSTANNEKSTKENVTNNKKNKDNSLTKFLSNIKKEDKVDKSCSKTEIVTQVDVHQNEKISVKILNTSFNESNFKNNKNAEKTLSSKVDANRKKLLDHSTPESKLDELCKAAENSTELDINDIENDSDNSFNLNETLQKFQSHTQTEVDCYLETTTEADYSDILKSKQEFPKLASNFSVNFQNIAHFGDTSNSFFVKYVQNMNSNPEPVEVKPTNEIPGCSCTRTNTCDDDLIEIEDDNNLEENGISPSDFGVKECPECDKRIAEEEYVSHMDFHMAMSLMEEEKKQFREHVQVEKQKLVKSPSKQIKSKSVKRKAPVVTGNHSISSYFNNTTNEYESNIPCPECGKLFRSEEIPSHLDFHAAKRLHLELNPVQIVKSSENRIANSNKKQKANNNLNSIVKFLKPVQN